MKEGSRIECLSKYQGFNMVGSREQEGNKDGEIENWFQEDGVCIKKDIHRLQKGLPGESYRKVDSTTRRI